ncbi:MAG: PQQ-binding-like beta-propeller repeat protein, partial [Fretibacterium sp.]|nr:PQQ-binding-like beta-propeller repeat protein [Fretibacterium sp.]
QNYGTSFYADFYKYPDYGYHPSSFPNGSAPSWSIGFGNNSTSYGGNYYQSSYAYCGVLRDYYDKKVGSSQWAQVNRSVLRVPFDYFYKARADGSGGYEGTSNLQAFRSYIDGIETANGRTVINPELFADGQTPLACSLYGRGNAGTGAQNYHVGKADSYNNYLIQYAPQTLSYGNSRIELATSTNSESLRAGQAVGSAIDFFSPRYSTGTSNGLKFGGNEGFFPVQDSCQANWVVVFTAGNDEVAGARTAAEAALELYKNSLEMRGREWKNKSWVEKTYAMNKGIRTLVVGFVDPEDKDPNSVKLRKTLNDIAAHGQPKNVGTASNPVWEPDYSKKALFANDVPSLLAALEAIFKQIDAEGLPGASGSPMATLDSQNPDEGALYGSGYTERPYDQWRATFKRYNLNLSDPSQLTAEELWEAGALMKAKGDNRPLHTVEPGDDGIDDGGTTVKHLSALGDKAFSDAARIPQTQVPNFRKWLLTNQPKPNEKDKTPLGDMQNSNFVLVSSGGDGGDVLYIQTNQGSLHALNAESGEEIWGFIPPNVFKDRIRTMKFDAMGAWYSGDGKETLLSQPVMLLDGSLTARNYGTPPDKDILLIGTLGRGGAGLYAMDVTNTQNGVPPVFLWAIDNARYGSESEATLLDGVRRWGRAAGNPDEKAEYYDYTRLGLTLSPACLVKSSSDHEVAILPAGLGHTLGVDDQGKALYLLNPRDGSLYNTISDDIDGGLLGMMVTPVAYFERDGVLDEFLTADSEGNLLRCAPKGAVPKDWTLERIFRVTTTDGAKGLLIPYPLLAMRTRDKGKRWLYSSTGNLRGPDREYNSGVLENPEQLVFGVNLNVALPSDTTRSLRPLSQSEIDMTEPTGTELPPNPKGWYLKLRPASGNYEAEYPTTSPYSTRADS